MAEAVAAALEGGTHLLVQAGTGTGKSLGYLVPALASGKRVVVATATKALQAQLVDKDLPRVVEALAPALGRTPTFALAKGRSNYVCLQQLGGGGALEPEQDELWDGPTSMTGQQVVRLRVWAQDAGTSPGQDVGLFAHATDGDGTIHLVSVTWGDGKTSTTGEVTECASKGTADCKDFELHHAYAASGTYSVTITLASDGTLPESSHLTITEHVNGPSPEPSPSTS
jgi:Rad3-related DNA helicase